MSQLGDASDIDHALLSRHEVGRELADHLADAQRLGPGDSLGVGVFGGSNYHAVLACDQSPENPLAGIFGAADASGRTADNLDVLGVVDEERSLLPGVAEADEQGGQGFHDSFIVQRDLPVGTELNPLAQRLGRDRVILREAEQRHLDAVLGQLVGAARELRAADVYGLASEGGQLDGGFAVGRDCNQQPSFKFGNVDDRDPGGVGGDEDPFDQLHAGAVGID